MNKKRSFRPLDITAHCNHQIVYDYKNGEKVVGLNGDAFNEKGFLPFGTPYVSKEGVPFVCARRERLDNVMAAGQLLSVPDVRCRAVWFAGFMHWGAKFTYLHFIYDDGTADEKKLYLFDWAHDNTINMGVGQILDGFLDVRIMKRCISCCATGYGYKGPLFVSCCPVTLDGTKRLCGIRLPENECLHLFAVTLEE